jgi:plasmid maintenance system antidote protein VapI
MNEGIAQLPGFVESLRLLAEEEQYALSDIADMFGVSHERIRQLTDKFSISQPMRWKNGLRACRVWDDRIHRFRPQNRLEVRRRQQAARRVDRSRAQAKRIEEYQRVTTEIVRALATRIGSTPTWMEMWLELGGNPNIPPTSACPRLLDRWEPRRMRTRTKLRSFYQITGLSARPQGGGTVRRES